MPLRSAMTLSMADDRSEKVFLAAAAGSLPADDDVPTF
jgi:hypothetical protein